MALDYCANYHRLCFAGAAVLDYHLQALEICEKIGDNRYKATTLSGIAMVYAYSGDHPQALTYFSKCLELCETLGDKTGEALAYINQCMTYKDLGTYYTVGLGENIFQGFLFRSGIIYNNVASYDWLTPEEIAKRTVDEWMNSPDHRVNVLNYTYRAEGIGIAISDNNEVYFTQNFC